MKLALRDFHELKDKIFDCKDFIQKRDSKKIIGNVPLLRQDPLIREHEFKFLKSVVNELNRQIRESDNQLFLKPDEHLQSCVQIVYGAILVVRQDILDNKKYLASQGEAIKALDEMIHLTDPVEKINPQQKLVFFKQLNQFLSLIYDSNDSRKGFHKQHALQDVPQDILVKFTKISLGFEEKAQQDINNKIYDTEEPLIDFKRLEKESYFNYNFIDVAHFTFEGLKQGLHDLITEEKATKNAHAIEFIQDKTRLAQIIFLQTLEKELSKTNLLYCEKISIYLGAMYIIRGQIAKDTCREEPLCLRDLSPGYLTRGSIVHSQLSAILKPENISYENIEIWVQSAYNFIRHSTISTMTGINENNKAINVEVIDSKHFLSDIKHFELKPIFTIAINIIQSCRSKVLDRCVMDLKKEMSEKIVEPQNVKAPVVSNRSSFWQLYKTEMQKEYLAQDEEQNNIMEI